MNQPDERPDGMGRDAGTGDSLGQRTEEMADEAQRRGEGLASEAADQARDAADQARTTTSDMAGRAQDAGMRTADSGREGAAGALERAASTLEGRTGSDGATSKVAGRAAGGMHAAADYLQEHETTEIVDEVEHYVRSHPMQAVAGAVAAGFIVGRILR
ncbi:MAG: hypothetical protein WD734_01450 [Dehalococcoidia bacterium]